MEIGLNKLKRFEYSDILGWSVSRYDKFLLCKRQYYYDYYAKYDHEFSREKISKLKIMTSIPLEIGNIVHDIIKTLLERLLKSENPIDITKFFDYAKIKTNEYCKSKIFAEMYYKELDNIDVDKIFKRVKENISNFIVSERFKWITSKAITNKSGWIIEPPGYGETRINNLKAYCKVDFLFPVDGNIYILDWKTGKRDEIKQKKQLIGYTVWAAYHFDKNPDTIIPMAVYLHPGYNEMPLAVNKSDLDNFVNRVQLETQEMYNYCVNIENNIPKDKKEFIKTTNIAICRFCNYRELCR